MYACKTHTKLRLRLPSMTLKSYSLLGIQSFVPFTVEEPFLVTKNLTAFRRSEVYYHFVQLLQSLQK